MDLVRTILPHDGRTCSGMSCSRLVRRSWHPLRLAMRCLAICLAMLAQLAVGPDIRGDEPPSEPKESQEEFMAFRGLVRHDGRWRTPQEVSLLEQRAKVAAAQREWAAELDRLRRESDDPSRASVAIESIREIDDPLAVAALTAAVANDRQFRSRNWYLEALARIGSADAVGALVAIGLDHPDPETRIAAVEWLAVDQPPMATVGFLVALAGPDNARINRAAAALGLLGDASVVLSLIGVLETEHVVVDPGNGGGLSATFTPGQGGLSAGGGPEQRRLRVRNEEVLAALVRLTDVNFEWQADAWRAWVATKQNPESFDPRRD